MILKELAPPTPRAVPIDVLSAQLRLGHGFEDDGAEDGLLEMYLRSAIAAVEQQTGQILLTRSYRLATRSWNRAGHLVLPVGPVRTVHSFRFVRSTALVDLPEGSWEIDFRASRPVVTGIAQHALPHLPASYEAEFIFDAGHADEWDGLPDDLVQAVVLLAAYYFENRDGQNEQSLGMPSGVLALLQPHRPIRL